MADETETLLTVEELKEELVIAAGVVEELPLPDTTRRALNFCIACTLHLAVQAPQFLRHLAFDIRAALKDFREQSTKKGDA